MDFRLTEEQEMIRQMAADFAANEIVPYCIEWDKADEVPLETIAKMQELGLMTIGVPAEYGGDGLDNVSKCLVCEEISKGDAGLGTTIAASTLLASDPVIVGANDEQKKWWYGRQLEGGNILESTLEFTYCGSTSTDYYHFVHRYLPFLLIRLLLRLRQGLTMLFCWFLARSSSDRLP
jgi:alkylation response protein AidB-like acyl-CoA dehydrogenase